MNAQSESITREEQLARTQVQLYALAETFDTLGEGIIAAKISEALDAVSTLLADIDSRPKSFDHAG